VVVAARSDRAPELYHDGMARGADWLMERPIGRLADKFGEDSRPRVERALSPSRSGAGSRSRCPPFAQKLDIAQRVEKKILDFPTPQLEALVRGVTERELR
jgi:hypothetical protein